jgi:hypothetical protein
MPGYELDSAVLLLRAWRSKRDCHSPLICAATWIPSFVWSYTGVYLQMSSALNDLRLPWGAVRSVLMTSQQKSSLEIRTKSDDGIIHALDSRDNTHLIRHLQFLSTSPPCTAPAELETSPLPLSSLEQRTKLRRTHGRRLISLQQHCRLCIARQRCQPQRHPLTPAPTQSSLSLSEIWT